jgi:hypothetical protein
MLYGTTPARSRERRLAGRHGSGWTGECSDAGARLFQELPPDRERVPGPLHPGTRNTRNGIAYRTAMMTEQGGQARQGGRKPDGCSAGRTHGCGSRPRRRGDGADDRADLLGQRRGGGRGKPGAFG